MLILKITAAIIYFLYGVDALLDDRHLSVYEIAFFMPAFVVFCVGMAFWYISRFVIARVFG